MGVSGSEQVTAFQMSEGVCVVSSLSTPAKNLENVSAFSQSVDTIVP